MDKNRVEGSIREAKGAVEQAIGKVVGDAKMQSDGKAEQAAGKVQNAIGGVSDALRDAVKKVSGTAAPVSPATKTDEAAS